MNSVELVLNKVAIQSRESDGFINATQMCKAGGKLFADWNRLSSTQVLINELSSNTGIPICDLVKSTRANSGSWIHPDLAVQLAQWISPKFALQVSRWIDNLKGVCKIVEIAEVVPMNSGELVLNKVAIQSRESDGFINATQMCKAGGKKLNDWSRLDSTKVLTEQLNLIAGYPAIKTEPGRYGGTWIHPDLAVQLAQWISPKFALQVSRWIRELVATGSVRVDSIKTDEHLRKIAQRPHINILPYKDCDVLYILTFTPTIPSVISESEDKTCYKFGVAQNIDIRLSKHETDRNFSNVILTNIYKCNSRSHSSDLEKIVKRFTKTMGFHLKCGTKKECFMASDEEYQRVVNHIEECLETGVEIEDVVEIAPKIVYEDYKTKTVTNAFDLFKDNKLSFEQLLQILNVL